VKGPVVGEGVPQLPLHVTEPSLVQFRLKPLTWPTLVTAPPMTVASIRAKSQRAFGLLKGVGGSPYRMLPLNAPGAVAVAGKGLICIHAPDGVLDGFPHPGGGGGGREQPIKKTTKPIASPKCNFFLLVSPVFSNIEWCLLSHRCVSTTNSPNPALKMLLPHLTFLDSVGAGKIGVPPPHPFEREIL
jgi:hypothetical protein